MMYPTPMNAGLIEGEESSMPLCPVALPLDRRPMVVRANDTNFSQVDVKRLIWASPWMNGADAHRAEQELGAGAAAPPRLVDLGGRDRLGEGQLRVLDHHAPEQRDEHDAEDAAGDHDERGLQVVARRREVGPDARDVERRDREDRARGDRLADRAHGAREVLLQDGAAHGAQHRHPDHRRRIGRGDRHPRLEAQVRVGRAEHHAHHQADDQRADRELRHVGVRGHVGLERLAHEAPLRQKGMNEVSLVRRRAHAASSAAARSRSSRATISLGLCM